MNMPSFFRTAGYICGLCVYAILSVIYSASSFHPQVVLLADILPTLFIKITFPWFMHVIPYWSVARTGRSVTLPSFCTSQCASTFRYVEQTFSAAFLLLPIREFKVAIYCANGKQQIAM